MIYLSRQLLDPRSRAVQHDLADCHQLHRTVMHAFPTLPDGAAVAEPREHYRVLYRVDEGRRGLSLLVQSAHVPDWSHLLPGYLHTAQAAATVDNPSIKRVDHLYDELHPDMVLTFRLRANPTRKIDTHGGPTSGERRNGRRVELYREEDRLAWLHRKAGQHGFEVLASKLAPGISDAHVGTIGKVTGHKMATVDTSQQRCETSLTFGAAVFEGRLRVVDSDALRNALVQGIGSGKAYGFGLLSLAPARQRDAMATTGTMER